MPEASGGRSLPTFVRINDVKRIVKITSIFAIGVIAVALIANQLIRVAKNGRSWGSVEGEVLRRPLIDALAPPWSDNFKKWDAATKASADVADILRTHGIIELTESTGLVSQRARAVSASKTAYFNAVGVSRTYLEASNSDLPDIYFTRFVPAMNSFYRGLSAQDVRLVKEGALEYDKFIEWMKSQKQSDFKRMR